MPATGNESWKGLTWGMMPLFGGALAACTYHFFYNSPTLDALVALQVCHSGLSEPHQVFSSSHSLDMLVALQTCCPVGGAGCSCVAAASRRSALYLQSSRTSEYCMGACATQSQSVLLLPASSPLVCVRRPSLHSWATPPAQWPPTASSRACNPAQTANRVMVAELWAVQLDCCFSRVGTAKCLPDMLLSDPAIAW